MYPQPAVPGRFVWSFCGCSAARALSAVVVADVPRWHLPVPLQCWVGSHQAHVPMVEGVTPFYLSKRFLVPVILRTSPRAVLLACDLNSPVGYSFLWAECSAVRSVLC